MKSTKFRPINQPVGAFEIWSHRKFRGYVYPLLDFHGKIVHDILDFGPVLITGWAVRALDGTRIGNIFETRRKATIRLLTDNRFNAKVKL
jgi:hypothetical protein